MMRALKLVMATVLLCALCAPSWAYYNPFDGWGGYNVTMHLTNYDVGTLYHNLTVGSTYDQPALNALPLTDLGGAYKTLPLGSPVPVGGSTTSIEDTWGIFRIDTIDAYLPGGDETNIFNRWDALTNPNAWEIVGIFYGGKDAQVEQTTTYEQEIRANGIQAAFFAEYKPAKDFKYARAHGPGARNTPHPELEGVTESESKTGYKNTHAPGLPSGTDPVPLWTFESVPGFNVDAGEESFEFFNRFYPGGTTGSGTAGDYAGEGGFCASPSAVSHWGTGTNNWQWQDSSTVTDTFGGVHPYGVRLEFGSELLDATIPDPTDPAKTIPNWLVKSKDPLNGAITPELPSGALLLLGMFPVGLAWLRRRKD